MLGELKDYISVIVSILLVLIGGVATFYKTKDNLKEHTNKKSSELKDYTNAKLEELKNTIHQLEIKMVNLEKDNEHKRQIIDFLQKRILEKLPPKALEI